MSNSNSNCSSNAIPRIYHYPNELIPKKKCFCNKDSTLRTSWTNKNPTRRFFNCRFGRCKFWEWHDEEMSDWQKFAVNQLVAKVKDFERDAFNYADEGDSSSVMQLRDERTKLMIENEKNKEDVHAMKIEVEKLKERNRVGFFLILLLVFIILLQMVV